MNESLENYAKILLDMNLEESQIIILKEILQTNDLLIYCLSNPSVSNSEKYNIVEKIFSGDIKQFIKLLCVNNKISNVFEILEYYNKLVMEKNNVGLIKLTYIDSLDKEQIDKLKEIFCSKLNKTEIVVEFKEDKSILGGCIVESNGTIYDRSIRGALNDLEYKLLRG